MVRARLAAFLTVLTLVPLSSRAEAQAPALIAGDGTTPVVLTGLPAVLGDETIKEELRSGLTNTLLLLVTVESDSGPELRGVATIDIRYELWDEVFLITVTGPDDHSRQLTITSFEALLGWWQNLELDIMEPGTVAASRDRIAKIELRLLPFSQAEKRDAQLWLTRSVRDDTAGKAADDPASPGGDLDQTTLGVSLQMGRHDRGREGR
jgi:hypothetical protein